MESRYLGYLGPIGSFSEEAARKYIKERPLKMYPYPHLMALVEAYLAKEVEKVILPIENSIEGAVTLTLDLLQEKRVQIIDEVVISIHQNLLLIPGAKIHRVTKILSHPQGIAQSRGYLRSLSPSIELEHTASTAQAAKRVREEGREEQGAIASLIAAERYELEVVAQSIEETKDNQTRFVVLGEEILHAESPMKTSIIVSPHINRPGVLYEILKCFADYQVDLTRIESRPTKKALGEYIFYIDFEGYLEEEPITKALKEIEGRSSWIKILGSYPIWKG